MERPTQSMHFAARAALRKALLPVEADAIRNLLHYIEFLEKEVEELGDLWDFSEDAATVYLHELEDTDPNPRIGRKPPD